MIPDESEQLWSVMNQRESYRIAIDTTYHEQNEKVTAQLDQRTTQATDNWGEIMHNRKSKIFENQK